MRFVRTAEPRNPENWRTIPQRFAIQELSSVLDSYCIDKASTVEISWEKQRLPSKSQLSFRWPEMMPSRLALAPEAKVAVGPGARIVFPKVQVGARVVLPKSDIAERRNKLHTPEKTRLRERK